ncbi:DUF4158 domain-containing protein, partial [Nonomuraea sp. RK-328]|nr:DUF4158 domain-containing protein [Nonomuraea sp. RK-328]
VSKRLLGVPAQSLERGCGVTSIERTAYPRFKRFLSARELHVFYTPQTEEIAWASGQVRSDNHLLVMVQLKCFNRMGYFPRLDDVPEAVVAHIRRDLGLGEDVAAVYDSDPDPGPSSDADPPA